MNKRCIDYNSIQVKELSDELGLKPIIVAAKIAIWQDKNNTDKFPSANNLVEGMKSNEKTTLNQTEVTIGNKKYKQGIYSFKEIFENIGDKSYANKLLKMLYNLSNQNIDNMKVEIVDNIVEAGHFDNGIIRLNINSLNPETVFTHEVIHALTALKLAYWKKNSPKVYESMSKIWIDSKAILDPSGTRYEFSSVDEFYAALSKQSFVEELAAVKDDSFIGKLIQLFKDMLSKLGIKVEGTLAEKALNNLTDIVKSEIGSNKRIETILKGISSRKYDKIEIDESEDYHFGYYKGWYYSYNEEDNTYEKYKDSETIIISKEEYYKDLDDYRKDNSTPKSLAKLAQSLLDLPLNNTLRVRYAKHLEGAFGNFVLDENTINIASSTNKSRVFLHEYIHSLTHSILKTYINTDTFFENDNYSKEELEKMYEDDTWRDYFSLSKDRKIQKFVDKIHELYYYAVDNANDTNYYGFTNLDEFIAEAFTNKDFQLELATIPYKNDNVFSNLFKEFISAINKLLGIPIEHSVLSEIISVTDELLSTKLPILKSEGGQEMQGKLSKDNVQVGDLLINKNIALRVTSLNENDLTTEDGQTIPYDADFNVFRVAPNEISNNKSIEDVPFNEHESELSENKPIEDLAMKEVPEEKLDNTVLEVEEKDLDWWRKIYLAYDAMKKELANTSQSISGKILYNDSSSHAKSVEKLHEDNLTDTPMLKAIKQAASIALYVSNLKYNLLTKGEVSVDESAQTNVLNSPLLGLAKKIKEAYKGDTSTWTNEEHIKYNKMAEYINTYVEKHSPDLKNLKQIIRQSRNQTNDINDYLRSIGQAGKFETTLEEMQTVIDAMEEIQFVMKSSSHFPSVLMINNREEIAKKIASDNEQITRANNKIETQIAQKEARKIKKPEETEKLEEDIAKLKNSIKPLKSLSNINEIQNSLMTGNDNGFLKAVTGSIHDLGDTSMSLLANRVQESWQKMQNSLAPIGKEMTDAWNDFAADEGMIFSDDVMKNFTEIIEYTDMQGIDRVEKHFISDRDLVAYYADYHETANKIKTLFDEIAENKKGISTKPVADAAEDAQQKADNEVIYAKNRQLHAKIKEIQEEFTKKQVFDANIIDVDEEGNAIPEGKNGIKNFLERTYQAYMKADPNQGFRLFSHYLKSNFDISSMQYENKSWRNNSEESYIAYLVDKKFPDILIKKYNSKLLKPKSTSYPSDKISKLTEKERKLFNVVTSIYYNAQKNLPSYSRPGTRVPSVAKEWMQKNVKDKLALGKLLNEEFGDHFSDETSDNNDKKIPIYYIGNSMKANEISDNYVSTVLLFAKQAAAYRVKADNLYLAKEMQHTLQKSKKQDKQGNTLINKALAKLGVMEGIPEDTDWRQWFLEKWTEQVFYGKSNRPISVKGVRIDKILDKLMGFSAFGTLGGVKIVNFFTNISMANISNLMNSIGYFEGNNLEKLYSASQYAKAVVTSGRVMFDMLLDHSRQTEYSSSVFAELMDELEPLQGEYFDKFGNQLNRNFLGKAFSTSTWFAPMHLGEVQPQISAMIAMLENIPVTLLDGKKTTLWKALTITNDLSKNWQNIENWRTIKEDVLGKKKLKLEEINRKLHGNYKSMGGINKPIMRQFVFGRMLESYRKWIVPGVLFRYKEDDFSINRNERSEGKYRTLFNYILTDAKWMWEGIEGKSITPLEVLFPNEKNIDKLREYFSDEQLVNIRQAVMEQAFITLTSIIAVVLYALGKGGEDDDNYALMTAAAISMRLSRDFNFFQGLNIDAPFSAELILNEKPDDLGLRVPLTSGLSDALRIAENPFPMMKTLNQFDAMFEILTGNPSATYVSGKHKGESKLSVATMKLLGINIGTDGKIILDPITK